MRVAGHSTSEIHEHGKEKILSGMIGFKVKIGAGVKVIYIFKFCLITPI
jgi:hypothetical protein